MRHRTMAEYALEQLREAIILGELPAGTPLRLDELARSLGMSISPIREAVRQLEALGLAKHVPHQGARVLDFDVDELRDLFEVRLALESLAVRRAAERFTEEDADAARAPPRPLRRDARRGRRARDDACAHRLPLHVLRGGAVAVARGADPPGVGSLGALPPRAPRVRRRAAGPASRASTSGSLEACAAHDPQAAADALYEHLELASVFFETELGGQGIFAPR